MAKQNLKKRFYNFALDEKSGVRELYLDGDIAESLWWGDECTPQLFRDELFSGKGDIVLWINSYGSDVNAASQIYSMLMDYSGSITVKIYGMCASAASVVAMAAGTVLMSPTAMMVIHNPWTFAIGNKSELQKTIEFLDEVKEAIINAYEIKTSLARDKISMLMDDETPMSVQKAIALGFCDGILEDVKTPKPTTEPKTEPPPIENRENRENRTIKSCYARLNLITGGKS